MHSHISTARFTGGTLMLAVTILFASAASAQPTGNCDWTGGTDNDWHTAANWDCDAHDGVPTAGDEVTIAPGGAATVNVAADAAAWSLTIGIDDGSSTHSDAHRLETNADDMELSIGDGGVAVRQTGYFQLGKRQIFGIGSQFPQRATLISAGPVLVHGTFYPRNATIFADITLDKPVVDGVRGRLQARAWNVIHGQLHVLSGFLQPVVPGGFYGSGAPHIRVVGNDLIVEAGSSVQIYSDPGTISQPAIAVEGGVFDHRGNLSTSGSPSNNSQVPMAIDAEVINSGFVRTRLSRAQGLSFRGPESAEHENIGTIEIGALLASDTEGDAVDGFGLLIEPGRSLHNTGEVIIHRLRSAEGEVANTVGGTITDVTEVGGTGTHVLGFSGPQSVAIDITDAGTIERLHMTWHGEDHADAALHPQIAGTAHWWDLAATTAGGAAASGDLSLSLPRLEFDVPRVCRYVPAPAGWDCLPTDNSPIQATVYDLSTLSEWAMANYPDLLFGDRFEQP